MFFLKIRRITAPCFWLALFLPLVTPAQKPISGTEWCATQHQGAAIFAPPGISDTRSDSVDLLHTAVDLDLLTSASLSAVATIRLVAKVNNVRQLVFDLENLPVSEVKSNGVAAAYTYVSPALRITLPAVLNKGDSAEVRIVYRGTPVKDGSGWGGVYFQSPYTYNLGVGFAANPHSFGRAWVPCFDNFVERCSYEVRIRSTADKPGYADGVLISQTTPAAGQVERLWRLNQPIPSYLASFATGPFTSWKRTIDGIPVEIAAAASDTTKVRSTFKNLGPALACYQYWYGPYHWPRVGYSLVPFNSGAMEHATNIAIMRSAIDGTLNSETLWAHELSHHWWGDLATCSTAEDMWLNEGWASYSEHLFTEWVYGKEAYRKAVEDNFLDVLQNAHVTDGAYYAVSGVPHSLTYGRHVYNKGAVIAHNLRGYLGDSLFRTGIRAALDHTRFDDWSSTELRDKMAAATGVNLDDFFKDQVFAAGFSHFSVDSFRVLPNAGPLPLIAVHVRQKLRGAPHFYNKVPLEFTFVNAKHERVYRTAMVSGETDTVAFILPFEPMWVWVNTTGKLNLARAEKERVVKVTGNASFTPAKMDLTVIAVPDSTLLRVEHHFVKPDDGPAANPNGYVLTTRYWSVEGDIPSGFAATGRISYDGTRQMDQLDTELFAKTSPSEDSILLLYRPYPGRPWQEYATYQRNNLGTPNNKSGQILIQNLQPGQYTIAKGVSIVDTREAGRQLIFGSVSPNPAQHTILLKAEAPFDHVQVFNMSGVLVRDLHSAAQTAFRFSIQDLPKGAYRIIFSGEDKIGTIGFTKI